MRLRLLYCTAVLLLFTACGKETKLPDGPYEPPEANTVEFRNADNNVRVGLNAEPNTLLPMLSTTAPSRYLSEMIYQTVNGQDPRTFEQIPQLAGLPDVVEEPNGRVSYAYRLNPEATWPNGSPVTAADVVFSIKLFLSPLIANGAYRPYYDFVENVSTSPADEGRFKVLTDGPYHLARHVLGELVILPEYVYDPQKSLRAIRLSELASDRGAERLAGSSEVLKTFSDAFNDLASGRGADAYVGSGPYALGEWVPGQEIRLDRRENYWADGSDVSLLRNDPESITFKLIPDANTLGTALRDELVDVAIRLPVNLFMEMRDEPFLLDRYDLMAVPSLNYYGMLFNQNDPLFQDVETRRALSRLVDVDALMDRLLPGDLAQRVVGPVLPDKSYYNDDLKLIAYEPDLALKELREAGWEDTDGDGLLDREIDGERRQFEFDGLFFGSATSRSIASLMAEWAAEAGIKMNPVFKEFNTIKSDLNSGDFSMSIIGQGFSNAEDDYAQVWASTSVPPAGTNRGGFASNEADNLIRRINRTLDTEKREEMHRRFQEIVYDNHPMIFLFSTKDRLAVSRRFEYDVQSQPPNVRLNALRQHEWNRGK